MEILIVDDDKETLDCLKVFFENLGHTVEVMTDPERCLEYIAARRPDLVLADIVMPQKDGLALLKEIKEIDREASVCMITAHKDIEHVIDAFRLGAMDCLLKPFHYDYIRNILLPLVPPRKR